MLRGVATLSAVKLPHAEESIHEVISEWGFTLPLELYIWQRGLVSAPMLRTGTWFEYLLVRHPGILLGGFPLKHPALPGFLRAFWKAFEYDEPNHAIYTVHSNNLDACIPICFYGDEGRGVRKSPIQITALETLFGQNCFQDFLKLEKKSWSEETMWHIQHHTSSGSSLLSRLLLYVLPNKTYKGKRNRVWYEVCEQVGRDLAAAFTDGVRVGNKQYYLVLVGVKGDAPALCKTGRMVRTFQHLSGPGGICLHCLAGRANIPWEDFGPSAAWRATMYQERPWSSRQPSCLHMVPYSDTPERMFRSDCLHLVKLGVARHFLASSIVLLGEWQEFNNNMDSVEQIFASSQADFFWSCKTELKQTPHMKGFTKDLFHWPRRSTFPWGGFSVFVYVQIACGFLVFMSFWFLVLNFWKLYIHRDIYIYRYGYPNK